MGKIESILVGNQKRIVQKSRVNFFVANYRIECIFAIFTHELLTY